MMLFFEKQLFQFFKGSPAFRFNLFARRGQKGFSLQSGLSFKDCAAISKSNK